MFRKIRFRPFWWWHADTRGAEVISAVIAWSWGTWLLLPWDTFASASGYRFMSSLLPERTWGILFTIVGLLQSLAMCGNVHVFRYPAAVFSMVLWVAVSVMFYAANPIAHAPVLYGILAASQWWVILRGPQDHG